MPLIGDSAEQDRIHALMTLAHEVPHWQAAGRGSDKTFLDFHDDLIVQNGLSKSEIPQLKIGLAIKGEQFKIFGIMQPNDSVTINLVETPDTKGFIRNRIDGISRLQLEN